MLREYAVWPQGVREFLDGAKSPKATCWTSKRPSPFGPGRWCEDFAKAGVVNHGDKDEEELTPANVSGDGVHSLVKIMILLQLWAGEVIIPEE